VTSGKDKILEHLKDYLGDWVHNQELRQVSELNDAPRTIRLLKQEGWQIEVRGDGYVRLTSLEKKEARGRRAGVSQRVRYRILHRDGFRCRSCGRGPDDGVKLTIDHIVPVDWGGGNDESNLQTLCMECNEGKQAWVAGAPSQVMKGLLTKPSVESRIEALFDSFPNEDVSSAMIQLVSKGALDWQRALRRIRERTGKRILPAQGRTAYRYFKDS
jgi:5-methylcytosine-specific restriction endonuclease McrA